MASTAQIVVVDGPRAAATEAERTLRVLEAIWSRFIPTSDISHLNNAQGQPVIVSAETLTLIATMQEAWRISGGRYDPTYLPTLLSNGYTHSIDDPTMRTTLPDTAASGGSIGCVTIDPDTHTVVLPPTMTLDPGGLGKGVAADLTVARLIAEGAAGAMVSVGGDLAADGEAPTDEGWLVEIENPFDTTRELCTVSIEQRWGCHLEHTLTPLEPSWPGSPPCHRSDHRGPGRDRPRHSHRHRRHRVGSRSHRHRCGHHGKPDCDRLPGRA